MTTNAPSFLKRVTAKLPTLVLVLVAVIVAFILYKRWTDKPWTRDGQVRADLIHIAPRVSGYIVEVAVESNQFVREGELLFKIDPSFYQLSVDTAVVLLDQAREDVDALVAAVKASEAVVVQSEAGMVAAQALIAQRKAALTNAETQAARAKLLAEEKAGSVEDAQQKAANVLEIAAALDSANATFSQAEAAVTSAKAHLDEARAMLGEPGDANVRIRRAMVGLERAQLDLSWTTINAPADGFITNLEVSDGQFGAAGHPIAAFVDRSSFRVDGYFQESKLKHIKPGDNAIITLMSHKDTELKGVVDSIGYAINPPQIASTEGERYLVPTIAPTFDWIRLPQRVPVRIRLVEVPEDIQLISGTTGSVAIRPAKK